MVSVGSTAHLKQSLYLRFGMEPVPFFKSIRGNVPESFCPEANRLGKTVESELPKPTIMRLVPSSFDPSKVISWDNKDPYFFSLY